MSSNISREINKKIEELDSRVQSLINWMNRLIKQYENGKEIHLNILNGAKDVLRVLKKKGYTYKNDES